MPELPEVETVRRGLGVVMEGAQIVKADVNRPNLRFPFPADFAARLLNRHILQVARRAKYLTLYLDQDEILIIHLGMSGSFHIEKLAKDADLNKLNIKLPGQMHINRDRIAAHDHVILYLKQEENLFQVTYNDPRRFGFMDLIATNKLNTHKYFANLGIEPTGNSLDGETVASLFTNRNTPLKSALLDQKLIAGLGNIYVCEALWQAGLSPKRLAKTLGRSSKLATNRAAKLADAIRDVITRAIDAGGSSLNDHRQTDGTLGYFQHGFNVYDRADEACKNSDCQGKIMRIIQSGRSTYYCKNCQK